jgi:flagellar basal body-associated protein FliL
MYYYIEAVALLLLLLLLVAFVSVGAAISFFVCGNARETSKRGTSALPHERVPLMKRKLEERSATA